MEESTWSENKHLKTQVTMMNLGMGSVFSEEGLASLKKFVRENNEEEDNEEVGEVPLDQLNNFLK